MQEQFDVLVKRAMSHDETAFWRIYEYKWKDVFYTALKILGDENEAADAAQEAFLAAYKNIGSLREPKAFGGWLYRIVVNTCNSALPRIIASRKNFDVVAAEEVLAEKRIEFLPMEQFDTQTDQEALLEAIEALPVEQKTTLVLYYYDQMSYADIATATGVSKLGVETRLRRARKALKTSLKQTRIGTSVASALVAAPIITRTLCTESQAIVDPQVGDSMRQGLHAAIVAVLGTSGGVAAGGAATAAAAAGSSTAAAGSAVSSVAGTGMSVGAKLAALAAATTVVAGGVGAGLALSQARDPAPQATPAVVLASLTGTTQRIDDLTRAMTAMTPEKAPEAIPEKSAEQPAQTDAPKKSANPEKKPASIDSIADMIGAANAERLARYQRSPNKTKVRSFLASLGFRQRSEQSVDESVYRLYTLEKQDKRIALIEKSDDGYGISYRFGSNSKPPPEAWELMFEY